MDMLYKRAEMLKKHRHIVFFNVEFLYMNSSRVNKVIRKNILSIIFLNVMYGFILALIFAIISIYLFYMSVKDKMYPILAFSIMTE